MRLIADCERHSIRKNLADFSFSLFKENYLIYSLLLKTTASNLFEVGLSDWSSEKQKLCLDFDFVFFICFQKLDIIFLEAVFHKSTFSG